jgi:hypothetical protein
LCDGLPSFANNGTSSYTGHEDFEVDVVPCNMSLELHASCFMKIKVNAPRENTNTKTYKTEILSANTNYFSKKLGIF